MVAIGDKAAFMGVSFQSFLFVRCLHSGRLLVDEHRDSPLLKLRLVISDNTDINNDSHYLGQALAFVAQSSPKRGVQVAIQRLGRMRRL